MNALFVHPAGLQSVCLNLFRATSASVAPIVGQPCMDGFGTFAQYFLDMSIVLLVEEKVNLIVAQRADVSYSNAILASAVKLQAAISLRR